MRVTLHGTHERWELITYTDMFQIAAHRKVGKFEDSSRLSIDIDPFVEGGTMKVWCDHGSYFERNLGYHDLVIDFVCPISEKEYA